MATGRTLRPSCDSLSTRCGQTVLSTPNAQPPFRGSIAAAHRSVGAHARRIHARRHGASGMTDSLRVPAWIESAMSDLLIVGAMPGGAPQLWRQRQDLVSLPELFAMSTLVQTTDRGRPGRRALEKWNLLRLQSASVAGTASICRRGSQSATMSRCTARTMAGRRPWWSGWFHPVS